MYPMSFPWLKEKLKTDESFEKWENAEHHIKESPLCGIIKMVTKFPYDYMHLVCLGVTKRILNILVAWPKSNKVKEDSAKRKIFIYTWSKTANLFRICSKTTKFQRISTLESYRV